jgi:hypothetical protein
VVELTRLCAVQEFAKSCTNTSLALVSQQSPVGMDLGQPHSWRRLVGPRAGQAVVIALTVQHVHQHMHLDRNPPSGYAVPGRSADWSSTTTRLDEREVSMVPWWGDACTVQPFCTHIPVVCPLPCMVGGSWASDWKAYGRSPLQLDASFSLAGQSS